MKHPSQSLIFTIDLFKKITGLKLDTDMCPFFTTAFHTSCKREKIVCSLYVQGSEGEGRWSWCPECIFRGSVLHFVIDRTISLETPFVLCIAYLFSVMHFQYLINENVRNCRKIDQWINSRNIKQ
jgi:hypothetical protein